MKHVISSHSLSLLYFDCFRQGTPVFRPPSILFISFLGWPNVRWYYTEKLAKPPKDWRPPSSLDRGSPAYIEVGALGLERSVSSFSM